MNATLSARPRSPLSRYVYVVLACLAIALIAGCGSSPRKVSGGGGYYKDDGPGDDIPANIRNIPDAAPRIEPHNKANFRAYTVMGQRFVPVSASTQLRQRGVASWYGRKFHGKKTANGETYDMYAMTAAHPTLPLPSYARVTHEASGRSVIVRVNDRGPFLRKRVIDLSYAAAAKLGIIGRGSDVVTVEAITHADIRRGLNMASSQKPPVQTAAAASSGATAVRVTPTAKPAQAAVAPARPVSVAAAATPTPAATVNSATPAPVAAAYSAEHGGSAPGAPSTEPTHVATSSFGARPETNAAPTPDALSVLAMHVPGVTENAPAPNPTTQATPAPSAATSQPSTPGPTVMQPAATPAPTVTNVASEGIYLQFGAFGSYISADRLANRLNNEIAHVESRDAHISSTEELHRVRIGPYPNRTAAVNAAVRIQEATGMQPTLAQR